MSTPFNGILLVDKPEGWSSFKAVAVTRRLLSEQVGHKVKVGHAGTLDPFATGLLILLVGDACKEANCFLKLGKTYEVVAQLGQTSSTGDPEGELQVVSATQPTESHIRDALQHFTGQIMQTPPSFSAIKVNGVRAYKLARQGSEVKIEPRQITVQQIHLTNYIYPELIFTCDVSSGTYIRSLVQDIGEYVGCGAYTKGLRRTRIADYNVQDALGESDLTAAAIGPSAAFRKGGGLDSCHLTDFLVQSPLYDY
jgi:tRNA pseudouridine55 synthase